MIKKTNNIFFLFSSLSDIMKSVHLLEYWKKKIIKDFIVLLMARSKSFLDIEHLENKD